MLHDLKIKPSYFNFVRAGVKKAEFRLNDRDFKEGDLLKLREWLEDANGYTGEFIIAKITHITRCQRVENWLCSFKHPNTARFFVRELQ